MIFHPAVSDIGARYKALDAAVKSGNISLDAAVSRYAWVTKDNTVGLGRLDAADPAAADRQAGAIPFTISVYEEDRDGDVVVPKGCQLEEYARNPVVFFGHQSHPYPIAKSKSPDGRITVWPEENRIRAVGYFDLDDPDSDFIYQKILRGFLSATSIAFVPVEAYRRRVETKARMQADAQSAGWEFVVYSLTEWSVVGVPSCAGAIRDTFDREKSFMSPKLQKAWSPYCAVAKGCWNGWCPVPGEEKDIGGGVVLKAVAKGAGMMTGGGTDGEKPGDTNPRLGGPRSTGAKAIDTGEVDRRLAAAGEELQRHVDPAPMPGYGQIFVNDSDVGGQEARVWYVGGDGDEDGFSQVVEDKIREAFPGVSEVIREAEGFPPKDEGWRQVYPKQKPWTKHRKAACSCADCQEGKACSCGKSEPSEKPMTTQPSKNLTQADLDSPGVPGRNPNPEGDAVQEKMDRQTAAQQGLEPVFPPGHQYAERIFYDSREGKYYDAGSDRFLSLDEARSFGLKSDSQSVQKVGESMQERNQMRKLQDKFLNLAAARKWVADRGENAPFWEGGPSASQLRTMLYFQWKYKIEQLIQDLGGKSLKALSQSDGRIGGYTVPPGGLQTDEGQKPLEDPKPPGWAACEDCHGSGNCDACGGSGSDDGDNCSECGGTGECGACAGEGHVEKSLADRSKAQSNSRVVVSRVGGGWKLFYAPEGGMSDVSRNIAVVDMVFSSPESAARYAKLQGYEVVGKTLKQNSAGHTPPQVAPQARDVVGQGKSDMGTSQPSVPQVLAALYSHAKAEAAYIDQLNDTYKGTLSGYRDAMDKRVEQLKTMFADLSPDDDIEKMCKEFEDQADNKGMESTGPEDTMEPGEAGLVEQGQIPETEVEPQRKAQTMKKETAPADGAYIEGDTDAAGELDAGAAPFNKSAPELNAGDAPFNNDVPSGAGIFGSDSDAAIIAGDPDDAADKITDVAGAPFNKSAPELNAGDAPFNKDAAPTSGTHTSGPGQGGVMKDGGICMCGTEIPDGAATCPGCGAPAPVQKIVDGDDCSGDNNPSDPSGLPECGAMFHAVAGAHEGGVQKGTTCSKCGTAMKADPEDQPADDDSQPLTTSSTDPSTEEILERYRVPKSNKWATRKWKVNKNLLPFLKYRVAANGQKYLMTAKDAPVDGTAQPALDDDAVKSLTTKLAGAIDDIKALVTAKDLPRQYKAALKHVADQIWYVGKALTDKGKEQRNGGKGSPLEDKGKVQRNSNVDGDTPSGPNGELGGGGKGSLDSVGSQQGKSPAKSNGRQISKAVEEKLNETMAKLQRFGVLNGVN